MARRAAHAPERLREMIGDAAEEIIRRDGLAGLSAREIAKAVGYSPGTLYNAYANLDDIILHVEARVLDALLATLRDISRAGSPEETLHRLTMAYLAYTQANPNLWNLLFEHRLPEAIPMPPWYQEKIESLLGILRGALEPIVGSHDPDRLTRTTNVLWASVHGISSLATAGKLGHDSETTAAKLVDDLLANYISGINLQTAA